MIHHQQKRQHLNGHILGGCAARTGPLPGFATLRAAHPPLAALRVPAPAAKAAKSVPYQALIAMQKIVTLQKESFTKIIISFLFITPLFAQDSLILTPDALLTIIDANHPVGKQAQQISARARAGLLAARGGFDPKLYGGIDQKFFGGKTYYNYAAGGLKIPTRIGAEVKLAYETANGTYLSPENKLPEGGLAVAGVSLPLGQGLLIDARRAALRQAGIFVQSAEATRLSMLNDLYFDALKSYWEWSLAQNLVAVYGDAVRIATNRFNGVKQMYIAGDEPAIDTLESWLTVQTRQQSLFEAQLRARKSALELSNFLWNENGNPVVMNAALSPLLLDSVALPQPPPPAALASLIDSLPMAHPDLQNLRYALQTLEVERQLKADKLKPKVNVNYNVLTDQWTYASYAPLSAAPNNYKWGLEVSFPLYLREERGNLAMTRAKIQETNWKQEQKWLELQNKVSAYYAETNYLDQQIRLYSQALKNYQTLLEAEETKFLVGESSIFLINAREQKVLEAREKLLELTGKYLKATAGIRWAAGVLYGE